MSSPRCDECSIGCNREDMVIVYEPNDEGPGVEHKFCSMSCLEKYFFPGTQNRIKEKDETIVKIRCQRDELANRLDEDGNCLKCKEKDVEIATLRRINSGLPKEKERKEEDR